MHLMYKQLCPLLLLAPAAFATQMVYTFTGTATGTVGATAFTNAELTVSVSADSSTVGLSSGSYSVNATASNTAIYIAGVGSGGFTDWMTIQTAPGFNGSVFFSHEGSPLITITDQALGTNALASYDFSTPIGPLGPQATNPSTPDWVNIPTSLGSLTVTSETNVTFQVAVASPITYTFSGTATGKAGTTPFTNAAFSVALTATTGSVVYNGSSFYQRVFPGVATISIAGIGTGNFSIAVTIYADDGFGGRVSFSTGSPLITVMDDSLSSSVLLGYDLSTPIGPIGPQAGYNPSTSDWAAIPTSLGAVTLTDLNDVAFLAKAGLPAPMVFTGGVITAGQFGAFPAVAPGSWIEIYGANLAADSRGWTTGDFTGGAAPTALDNTRVSVGGQPAFVDFIGSGQVNVQVPSNIGTGSQPLVVSTAAGSSNSVNVTVNVEEPGLLAPASFKIGGTQYVAALFPDNSTYVLPPGSIPGVTSRRANVGDTIILYGVGFGPVAPASAAGQTVPGLNTLTAGFHLLIGGVEASLAYDGLAPGAMGLYQFNAKVPNVTPGDAVPLTFTLAGTPSTQTLALAIQ
jgi:uncharacterized protein (TIGR03437 family)